MEYHLFVLNLIRRETNDIFRLLPILGYLFSDLQVDTLGLYMNSQNHSRNISFSSDDVDLFSQASHDKNPLHLCEDYARKTPFSNRVVFGILGSLSSLKYIQDRPNLQLSKLSLDFSAPLYINSVYSLEIVETFPKKSVIRLYDGRRLISRTIAYFKTGKPRKIKAINSEPSRTEPAILSALELVEGLQSRGAYSPDFKALQILENRLNLETKGVGILEIAILLWASYFVGMELPGRQALFAKLRLNFEDLSLPVDKPIDYVGTLASFDDRYNLSDIDADLTSNGVSLAKAEIQAFLRSAPTISEPKQLEKWLPRSESLSGKVALVTGASRGLGAAIAQSLALQGCTVILNFLRSRLEAEKLQEILVDAPGEIILMQGDAAEPSWCLQAQQKINNEYGKLDFLICNACPAILPLWLEPASIERVNAYVAKSLALMSVPMSIFLEQLSENQGCNVIISSIYATSPFPPELPHYIISKCAIEGLAKVGSAEYEQVNFLLVRPPKLLTDQTNTPIGQQGAIPAEEVAAKIVQQLLKIPNVNKFEIMENLWPVTA